MAEPPKKQSKRGFAALSPEQRSANASKAGKAVRPENRAFSKSPELAAKAGKIGGKNVDPAKRSFSTNAELASAAGRNGGVASSRRKSKKENGQ